MSLCVNAMSGALIVLSPKLKLPYDEVGMLAMLLGVVVPILELTLSGT